MSVVWHDLECGSYREDLPLWRALAARYGDPVLDIGAGTGRVSLDLARAGYRVTALDRDPELLAELERRADGLAVQTVVADARQFELDCTYRLCIVPMQTIQLLGGREQRTKALCCARQHLQTGGLLAIALAEILELYEEHEDLPAPLPDVCELDGVVYSSQPTAVRADRHGFVLERRRETIGSAGSRAVCEDVVRLDRVSPSELEGEAEASGLTPVGRELVQPTADYSGSTVVMLRG